MVAAADWEAVCDVMTILASIGDELERDGKGRQIGVSPCYSRTMRRFVRNVG